MRTLDPGNSDQGEKPLLRVNAGTILKKGILVRLSVCVQTLRRDNLYLNTVEVGLNGLWSKPIYLYVIPRSRIHIGIRTCSPKLCSCHTPSPFLFPLP